MVVVATVVVVLGGLVVVGGSGVVDVDTAAVDGEVVCAMVEAIGALDATDDGFALDPHPLIATAARNQAKNGRLFAAIRSPPGTESTSHFSTGRSMAGPPSTLFLRAFTSEKPFDRCTPVGFKTPPPA